MRAVHTLRLLLLAQKHSDLNLFDPIFLIPSFCRSVISCSTPWIRLTALGLMLGFGWMASSRAAEPVQPVTPADISALDEMAAREMLLKPPAKSGMIRLAGFELFPRVSSSIMYDDNINIQSGAAQQSDLIWSLSPGANVLAGNPGVEIPPGVTFEGLRYLSRQPDISFSGTPAKMLLFNYSPTFKLFARHDNYNSIDQLAQLTGIYSFSRLILGLDQDYSKSLDTVADVGARTTSTYFTTRLTSMYQLSDRTSVEVNGQYRNTSYEDPRFTGSRQWENQNWINRQLSGKVNAGLGLTLGYWDVDRSGSQTYQQAVLRMIYRLAEKMDVTASVGGEWRQYSSGAPGTWDPIFKIGANYRPLDSTTISVEGHRFQQSSASSGSQNYTETGFSCNVRQRVFEKWFANLGGSYWTVDYHAAQSGISVSRFDTYYAARVGLDYQFTERWSVGAYYQHRSDSSNVSFGFENNQVGVQGSWQF